MAEIQSIAITSVEYRELPYNPGYRVGSDGTVWSRIGKRSKSMPKGCPLSLKDEWRPLSLRLNSRSGRLQVKIYSASLQFRLRHVAQLVLEAFVGERPEKMECCHNDGDKMNNRLENLRWDSKSANSADRIRHGIHKGERNGMCKLTPDQVRAIRFAYSEGATKGKLARMYGVSGTTITRVVLRIHWPHVD